jgi:hypothetical protein
MSRRSKHPTRPEPRRRPSLAARLAFSVVLVAAPLAVVLALRTTTPEIGLGALMMGIVLELLWLTGKPGSVAAMWMGALASSLLCFLPFRERVPTRSRLTTMPGPCSWR